MVLIRRWPRWGLLAGASLLFGAAPARAADVECPGGEMRADYGIRYRFASGEFVDGAGATRPWVHFLTEPMVVEVKPLGPSAGLLEPEDRIAKVDGLLVTTREGSRRFASPAGAAVVLGVRRGGRSLDLRVVPDLECASAAKSREPAAALPPTGWFGLRLSCEGCRFDMEARRWRFEGEPVITAVVLGGPAAAAGLRAGDVLVEIDGAALSIPEGARRFSGVSPGQRVVLTVRREGRRRTVEVLAGEPP